MRRVWAASGSVVFFALAPGVVAGLMPWWLTGWRARELPDWWLPLRVAGVVLLVAGAGVLVHAFVRFVVEGLGTPAPVAPTRELVVGQGLLLGRLVLLAYAAVVAAAFVAFVHWYEEPTLAEQFGDRYQAYRRAVPGWWPRRHPWRPAGDR